MSFRNDCAVLNFHKESVKGRVKDYQVSFNDEQREIQRLIPLTLDLFRQLVDTFTEGRLHARLIAKVNFSHVNPLTDEVTERAYHFASYKSEKVSDVNEFYQRHMRRIAERLDSFNINGSNLLIKNIAHIHIQCIVE